MHKKHKKQILSILLIPDNENSPRQFRIKYSTLKLLLALAVFIFLGMLTAIFTYGKLFQIALERDSLRTENSQLKNQLTKVNELSEELTRLKSYDQKVRTSLEGYVRFAEEKDADRNKNLALVPDLPNEASIFTSIPSKTPVAGFVSQEFRQPEHNGLDIAAPEGTPILAAGGGVVIFSGWSVNDGFFIILSHGDGYFSYYKHNSKNLVFPLERVHQGDVIGLLGSSGKSSSGPHLHFEIWKDGNPVDPRKVLVDLK